MLSMQLNAASLPLLHVDALLGTSNVSKATAIFLRHVSERGVVFLGLLTYLLRFPWLHRLLKRSARAQCRGGCTAA